MKSFLSLINKFFSFIFENSCAVCNRSSGQNLICMQCESSFTIRNQRNNIQIFQEITVYSWGFYDKKLRDGIIALKSGRKELAKYFAKRLIEFWETLPGKVKNENYIVVPVPSHKQRIKKRGYCQTTLIATDFAQMTGLNLSNNLVTRKKQTRHMNSLNDINERRENIKDAFEIINPINVKNILIIDDILTSGSTLCEVARTIHRHNPDTSVLGLTVAAGDRFN